jgi:hypothetical protein
MRQDTCSSAAEIDKLSSIFLQQGPQMPYEQFPLVKNK